MVYLQKKDQIVETHPFLTFSLCVGMAQGGHSSGIDEEDG